MRLSGSAFERDLACWRILVQRPPAFPREVSHSRMPLVAGARCRLCFADIQRIPIIRTHTITVYWTVSIRLVELCVPVVASVAVTTIA
jgi:hypothetical protein